MPLKSLGLVTLPELMRLHTGGCSANNCRLLAWGPGVIPCPGLCWNVACCWILSPSAHWDGWEGRVGRAGAQRWAESRLGVGSDEPGACASLAPSTEPWLWPRADRSCEPHPEQGNVQRRLKCAEPEYSSNPEAPGVAVTPMTSLASQLNSVIQMWQHVAVSLLLLRLNWCVDMGLYHCGKYPGAIWCLQNASGSSVDTCLGMFKPTFRTSVSVVVLWQNCSCWHKGVDKYRWAAKRWDFGILGLVVSLIWPNVRMWSAAVHAYIWDRCLGSPHNQGEWPVYLGLR